MSHPVGSGSPTGHILAFMFCVEQTAVSVTSILILYHFFADTIPMLGNIPTGQVQEFPEHV
jgi:hypothetical protein